LDKNKRGNFALFMHFGVPSSVETLFLRFGRRILLRVLGGGDKDAVRLPSRGQVQRYEQAFQRKHSFLTDVYAVMDGLKLYLQQSGDCVMQNMFYNGWKHDRFVGNAMVFVPDGTIVACECNAPGSMHDSQIAETAKIYSKLQNIYDGSGAKCGVDSAFAARDYPFLMKSSLNYLGVSSTPQQTPGVSVVLVRGPAFLVVSGYRVPNDLRTSRLELNCLY